MTILCKSVQKVTRPWFGFVWPALEVLDCLLFGAGSKAWRLRNILRPGGCVAVETNGNDKDNNPDVFVLMQVYKTQGLMLPMLPAFRDYWATRKANLDTEDGGGGAGDFGSGRASWIACGRATSWHWSLPRVRSLRHRAVVLWYVLGLADGYPYEEQAAAKKAKATVWVVIPDFRFKFWVVSSCRFH